MPSGKRVSFSALFAKHRFAQVDFHIGIKHWIEQRADADLILELQDFVKSKASGKAGLDASTKLIVPNLPEAIIPDGIFAVELNSGKQAIYLVEVHRATQTKAVTEQLTRYFEVIKSGVLSQKYGLSAHPVVCSVHQEPSVLANTKTRLQHHPEFETFKGNFVFRALDGLNAEFTGGWHYADDQVAKPFPLPVNPSSHDQ